MNMRLKEGSVLMEFIIVLPLYMLLLGFAFFTGELSLDAIHLASYGDRLYAVQEESFDRYKESASVSSELVDVKLSYEGDPEGGAGFESVSWFEPENLKALHHVADTTRFNPWIEMRAGLVKDSFTLPPWSRAMVAHWVRDVAEKAEDELDEDSALGEILARGGDLGRTIVDAKGRTWRTASDEPKYGYYTISRNLSSVEGARAWGAGQLADSWREKVADEAKATAVSNHGIIDGDTDSVTGKEADWDAMRAATASWYSRDYKNWTD